MTDTFNELVAPQLANKLLGQLNTGRFVGTYDTIRDNLRTWLRAVKFDANYELDAPEHSNFKWLRRSYVEVASLLQQLHFDVLAESLLIDWWETMGSRRLNDHEKYIYRADAGMMLAQHYARIGDTGMALRWALLTHAEDAMRGWAGEGKNLLRMQFSLSEDAISRLDDIAVKCNDVAQHQDQVCPERFSEEVVRRFLCQDGSFPLYEYIPQRPVYISKSYYISLIEKLTASHINTQQQGDRLEDLALYLVLTLPGCLPRRKMISPLEDSETDLLVHNLNPVSSLTTEIFQRHFLIECKNFSSAPMRSKDVGYFLHRMRLAHSRFGIIFSTTGITGSEMTNAQAHIMRTFQEDGSVCVVFALPDLEKMKDGKTNFWWMLFEKLEEVRFGSSR